MIGYAIALLVAAIHFYIAWLEMMTWGSKRTNRIFGISPELAAQTKAMATNQGLYNGFLAAGLLFGVAAGLPAMVLFLLLCVGVAGVVGAMTGVPVALKFQTLPAVLGLLAIWLGL